ncbi:glutathione S-transferase [Panacagrimonas perspica]|uniref:Glutathione S-transferase n=1 Tax=Panacagrimonas perspica TaxID=381431 RepID=A0A4S3K2N9_9GAMM|nr:glutathione S-transferase family protein [Panacagrimonas perspica]TDU28905.1 glutathione S-transferase [Panacagrimonas perspica]THD02270.1 hypothetical protein B1810_15185 [Panacagrimonas perspica]
MASIRILTYLPNPRVWKATIAGRLSGVEVDVRGAPVSELSTWLWDFDARALSNTEQEGMAHLRRGGKTGFKSGLFKSDRFLRLNPFGTVPAAFDSKGTVGVFESNSIMRTVARLGRADSGLYGSDAFTASRIDAFLDASLIFGRDTQAYLLGMLGQDILEADHARASQAFWTYMAGIESALGNAPYVAGESLSLADICFVSELALLHNELRNRERLVDAKLVPILGRDVWSAYPTAMKHFHALVDRDGFSEDCGPYMKKVGVVAK